MANTNNIDEKNQEANVELQDVNEILRIRRSKLEELQKNNKDPYEVVKYHVSHSTTFIIDNFEDMEGKEVSIAGRLMSKRDMGKASFCDVQDRDGRIQIYVRVNEIGEDVYEGFKNLI